MATTTYTAKDGTRFEVVRDEIEYDAGGDLRFTPGLIHYTINGRLVSPAEFSEAVAPYMPTVQST